MKFVKADPSILDHVRAFVDANPASFAGIAVLVAILVAAAFAEFTTRRF
jgi:hypothetical protein